MPARWKNDAALLFVVLVWGVNFPIIKIALAAMPPHVVNLFRFAVSAAVLGGLYAAQLRHHREASSGSSSGSFWAPMRTHGRRIAALGLLGYVAYQLCFIIGVNHTTAGSAALIMAAAPLWTAAVSRLLGYERLGLVAWAGLGLSLTGTALVIVTGAEGVAVEAGSLYGNLLMLAASFLWGAYTALNTSVVREVSPTAFTFMGLLVALPALAAIGVPYLGQVEWAAVGLWVWAAILFSGGLSTGIAFILWNQAVKDVGASSTAAYSNLVPFVALVVGATLLDEAVTLLQVIGGALIIGGLVVLRRARSRRVASERVAAEETA